MRFETGSDLYCSPFALREKGGGGMRVKYDSVLIALVRAYRPDKWLL